MQVDPEEFRRRFSELSDEALLEVNRDELVETAQELYDAELETRGLLEEKVEEAEAPPPEPDNPQDEMVQAGEFGSAQEVQFARSLLKSAGIPAYVKADFSGILAATEEETKLFVPASYLEAAKEILANPLTDDELAAQAEAAGEESGTDEENGEEDHDEDKGLKTE